MKSPKSPNSPGRAITKGNGSGRLTDMPANDCAESNFGAPGRDEMIAVAAYFRAEKRGFAPGNELDDWLQAKAELAPAEDG